MAIDAETERLMLNWARWKSGASVTLAMSSAYDLEARGRREATPMPLINGEGVEVDAAVEQLPPELKLVVIQFWTKGGTIRQKARTCGCVERSLYNRLDDAHHRIRCHLSGQREIARRAADAYRRQVACPAAVESS